VVIGLPRRKGRQTRTVVANLFDLIVRSGLQGWRRNLAANGPALGSMALLLLLVGVVGALGVAGARLLQAEAGQASVLHVYLRDGATSAQVAALRSRLAGDRRVVSLRYVSRGEALAEARRRPTLAALANDAGDNPFPASFDVRVDKVQDVAAVDSEVRSSRALDPVVPTSYDGGAYARLVLFLLIVAGVAVGFALLLTAVAVAVTGNSVRAAVVARLDEVRTMRLVGAPRWMVRAPFVVEGALTGLAAGLLAGAGVAGLIAIAMNAGGGAFGGFLPGLDYSVLGMAAGGVVAAGALLGAAAGLGGVRRMPA
jgi:cell division transport system permease protein